MINFNKILNNSLTKNIINKCNRSNKASLVKSFVSKSKFNLSTISTISNNNGFNNNHSNNIRSYSTLNNSGDDKDLFKILNSEKLYEEKIKQVEQLINQSRYLEAIIILNEAIKLSPSDPRAYAYRGEIYENTEKYDEAIEDFKKVIDISPTSIPVYSSLAACYLNKGEVKKAIKYFEHILVIDPNYLPANGYLGDIYLRENQLAKALEHYKKVLTIDPNHPIGLLGLGDLAVKNNNIHDAIKIYRQLVKVTKDRPIEFYHTIKSLDSSDDTQFIRDISKNPVFSAYVSLAYHLYATKEYEESEQTYKKVIEFNPNHSEAYSMLASIKLKQNKLEEALKYTEKACELADNGLFIRTIKGDILFDLGRFEEAIPVYKACLADLLEAENPDPEQAQTRLTLIHNLLLANMKLFESIPEINYNSISQNISEKDAKDIQTAPNTLYELNNKCRNLIKALEMVYQKHFPIGTIQRECCELSINILSAISLGCAESIQIQHRETQDPTLKNPNYEPIDDMLFDYYHYIVQIIFSLNK